MKQITQKDLINLIEEKQKNAETQLFINTTGKGNLEKGTINLARETNELNGEIKAYKNLINKLNDVEIVPERIETIAPKNLDLTREDLKKLSEGKPIIIPYIEPKVEPLRTNRFREYADIDCNSHYIDAKEISYIRIESSDEGYICIELRNSNKIWFKKNTLDYNELVKWWKYWKV